MIKVCQRPELIQQLNHGLNFASDEYVNEVMLTKYSLYEYLTPCDADNTNILNACINRWREEANKLYETTMFEYNPIENYNMKEHSDDVRTPDLSDKTTYDSDVTQQQTGYDVPRVLENVAKQINDGFDTVTHTGTESNKHDLTRSGNIGVMSTQQMIEMERKIIIDVVAWYVEKFNTCFNLSLEIDDYCCSEPCAPIPCMDRCVVESDTDKRLNQIDNDLGQLSNQLSECCTNMAEEIDALKKSSSDSKALLAGAITDKGVPTADDATFQTMADNISNIQTGGAESQVVRWFIEVFDAGAISYIAEGE